LRPPRRQRLAGWRVSSVWSPSGSRFCRRSRPLWCSPISRRSCRRTRSCSRSCCSTAVRSSSCWRASHPNCGGVAPPPPTARAGARAGRKGGAAPRLHIRIVTLFSVIAAVPAILVAVVASVTVDRGLDRLFSQQTHSLIENSLIVAEAYVREHAQMVRADTIATAIELARAKPLFEQNREQFKQFINAQAGIRGLPVITMLDKDLNVVDQAEVPLNQAFVNTQTFVKPPREALASVNEVEPQIGVFLDANYVAAIIKLRVYSDTYLYVVRLL